MSWEYRGIRGDGDAPPVLGVHEGEMLLVIGGARCVFDDLASFLGSPLGGRLYINLKEWSETKGNEVMAVNDIGMYLECKVRQWASLHAQYLQNWYGIRRGHALSPSKTILHSHQDHPCVDICWRLTNTGGLSGLFAAMVGVCMGYSRVVLAGCPTDGSGRFFDPPVTDGLHGDGRYADVWLDALTRIPALKDTVRSLSGNTKHWLGGP